MSSDLDLLLALRCGNRSVFQRLVRRHHLPLFNFFYALSATQESAEALCLRTFCCIFADRQKLRYGVTFNAYLYQLAVACWFEHRRSPEAHALPLSQTDNVPEGLDREQGALAHTPAALSGLELLNCLSAEHRLLVALKEIAQLRYAEIATVVDLPQSVVARRMNEAFGYLAAGMQARSQSSNAPKPSTRRTAESV